MTDPLMAAMDVTYQLLLNLHHLTPHNFDTRTRTDQLDTEQEGLLRSTHDAGFESERNEDLE
jgi:hypothetical protein